MTAQRNETANTPTPAKRTRRHIYLAAPFFNPAEQEIVGKLEEALSHANLYCTYFSPRNMGGNEDRQKDPTAFAQEIFHANEEAMAACSEILAWVDRPQIAGQTIRLVREDEGDPALGPVYQDVLGRPLEQTDLGVAYELGWFRARSIFQTGNQLLSAGFTLKSRDEGRLNVMLSQTFDIVLYGWEELGDFLACRDPLNDISFQSSWSGESE